MSFSWPWEKRPWPWLLVAACLLAYSNGLNGGFTYDDKAIVRDDPRIQSWSELPKIFTTHYFGGTLATGTAYRPVDLLSLAANFAIHGKSTLGYHLVNVVLHAGNVLLLFFLFRRWFGEPLAGISALFFAVMPVHVEAVTSIVGRAEVLSTFWLLLAWHCALRSRAGFRWLALAWVLYFLAIETKESAVVFPGLLFLGALLDETGGFARRFGALLKRRAGYFFSFGVPLAATFVIRSAVLKGFLISKKAGFFELENPLVTLSAGRRVGNAAAILLRGLGRVIFPLRLSADESAWQLRPYGFRSPVFWAASLGVGLLAAAALVLFRKRPPAGIGVLLFLLASLPTSNFLFVTGTIMAERLLYLPSAGIALVMASCFPFHAAALSRRRGAVAAIAAVALLFLARTIVRNSVWLDDRALFSNLVVTSPDSAKAHYDLAYEDADKKRFPSSYRQYRRATEIYGNYYDAWAGRGRIAGELGDLFEAVRDGRRSVQIFSTYENGWFTAAFGAERRGDFVEAETDYREGVRICPKSYPLAYHWALFLWRRGRADEAAAAFGKAIALEPDMALNHDDLGRLYASKGWSEKAEEEWDESLEDFENDGVALGGLARIAEQRDDFEEAAGLRLKLFEADRERSDLLLLLRDAARSPEAARKVRGRWGTWMYLQPALFSDPDVREGERALPAR
ncbi:MAG: glycosyltransferase family 39 protein [Thermoanaerobaculia bacterium]